MYIRIKSSLGTSSSGFNPNSASLEYSLQNSRYVSQKWNKDRDRSLIKIKVWDNYGNLAMTNLKWESKYVIFFYLLRELTFEKFCTKASKRILQVSIHLSFLKPHLKDSYIFYFVGICD